MRRDKSLMFVPHIGLELNSGDLVYHRPGLRGVMRKEDGGGPVDRLATCGLCWFFVLFLFLLLLFCLFLFLTRVQGLRRAMNWLVWGLRVYADVPIQPQ